MLRNKFNFILFSKNSFDFLVIANKWSVRGSSSARVSRTLLSLQINRFTVTPNFHKLAKIRLKARQRWIWKIYSAMISTDLSFKMNGNQSGVWVSLKNSFCSFDRKRWRTQPLAQPVARSGWSLVSVPLLYGLSMLLNACLWFLWCLCRQCGPIL